MNIVANEREVIIKIVNNKRQKHSPDVEVRRTQRREYTTKWSKLRRKQHYTTSAVAVVFDEISRVWRERFFNRTSARARVAEQKV